ncbi:hypothetical protein CR513_18542, partial [Mucuna pruriens]
MDLGAGCIVGATTRPWKPPSQLHHLKLERNPFHFTLLESNSREQEFTPNSIQISKRENIFARTVTLQVREAINIFTSVVTPLHLVAPTNKSRCGDNAAIEIELATLHQKAIVPRGSKVGAEKRVYESHTAVALRWQTNEYAVRGYVLNLQLTDFDLSILSLISQPEENPKGYCRECSPQVRSQLWLVLARVEQKKKIVRTIANFGLHIYYLIPLASGLANVGKLMAWQWKELLTKELEDRAWKLMKRKTIAWRGISRGSVLIEGVFSEASCSVAFQTCSGT